MIKILSIEDYKQLWEDCKSKRRIEVLSKDPGESNESYKARLHEYLNPPMPREIDYWTHEGLVTYRIK